MSGRRSLKSMARRRCRRGPAKLPHHANPNVFRPRVRAVYASVPVVATTGPGFSCAIVRFPAAVAVREPRFCNSMQDNDLITQPLLCRLSYGGKFLSTRYLRQFIRALITDHGGCRDGCRVHQIYHRNAVAALGTKFEQRFSGPVLARSKERRDRGIARPCHLQTRIDPPKLNAVCFGKFAQSGDWGPVMPHGSVLSSGFLQRQGRTRMPTLLPTACKRASRRARSDAGSMCPPPEPSANC